MTWNYRVVKRGHGEDTFYGIYEVYYDKDGKPELLTENPIYPIGDSIKELTEDIGYMLLAFEKPILIYEDFLMKGGYNGENL